MTKTSACNFKMKHRFADLRQSPFTNLGHYEENDAAFFELTNTFRLLQIFLIE
jgi:hypothetical protein